MKIQLFTTIWVEVEVAFRRISVRFLLKRSPNNHGFGFITSEFSTWRFFLNFLLLIWQGILFAPHLYRPTFVPRARAPNERAREWPWVPSMGEPCHGWMISGGTGFGLVDGRNTTAVLTMFLFVTFSWLSTVRMCDDFERILINRLASPETMGFVGKLPQNHWRGVVIAVEGHVIQEEFRLKFLTAEWLSGFFFSKNPLKLARENFELLIVVVYRHL